MSKQREGATLFFSFVSSSLSSRGIVALALVMPAAAGAAVLAGCPQSQVDICVGAACGEAGADDAGSQILPPGCDITKEPKDSPACVDDRVGLFVSPSGSDTNPGTKAAPLATIGAAAAKANAQQNRIYICIGTYAEHVTLTTPASLFGGFDCNDWGFVDVSQGAPRIAPSTPGYALDVELLTAPVTIGELELDVTSADDAGVSSIAAFVNSSTVTFSNDTIVAAVAGNGANGTLPAFTMPSPGSLNGVGGSGGNGGPAVAVTCPAGDSTVGGKGGNSGFPGDPGQPALDGGAPGTGTSCTTGNGSNGANAATVADGVGAPTTGVLDASGWHPAGGTPGAIGKVGQGGGGGAGFTGNGGASGGAGGCGGAGGGPGGGGGASIAIAAFASNVNVKSCHLTASTAGNGGAGSPGQPGQAGGLNGGGVGECNGGAGGNGSSGGSGGGGAGGLSIGVLTKGGTPPAIDPSTSTVVAPSGGTKGTGGTSGTNDGVPGVAQSSLDLN